MARGGHGLPQVSPRAAVPDPSTHCGRATPEKFQAVFCPFGHTTPNASENHRDGDNGKTDENYDGDDEDDGLDDGAATTTAKTTKTTTLMMMMVEAKQNGRS
jgi:hypothetical protein